LARKEENLKQNQSKNPCLCDVGIGAMKERKGHKRILQPCCTMKDEKKKKFQSIYIKVKKKRIEGCALLYGLDKRKWKEDKIIISFMTWEKKRRGIPAMVHTMEETTVKFLREEERQAAKGFRGIFIRLGFWQLGLLHLTLTIEYKY